uniref:mediator of RNA polymerase II transcription subunit 4 n=1 Tax=Myxine glutinosa TaxID=7769 RepID=UPI00358EA654
MAASSTRVRLEGVLDDIEILSKELVEILAVSRAQKSNQPGEEVQVMELLIAKESELQELLGVASGQVAAQQEVERLQEELHRYDVAIQQLQWQLKDAEHILATAVYQAKEKLKSIEQAKKGSVMSEELIKYAHRISASNAVAAPLAWMPGDPRRPYPTDLEMRSGTLGQLSHLHTSGLNGHLATDALADGRLPEVLTPQYPGTWGSGGELGVGMLSNTGQDVGLELAGHNKENEDEVDVMSTDSSSSSSDSD